MIHFDLFHDIPDCCRIISVMIIIAENVVNIQVVEVICELANSLQVRQLSVQLDNLEAQYVQFDDLLRTAAEKLDITEHLLDKHSTSGNIDVIASHINSIQVQCISDLLWMKRLRFQ